MFVASAKSRFSHDVAHIIVLIVAWMSLQNEKANKEMNDGCMFQAKSQIIQGPRL